MIFTFLRYFTKYIFFSKTRQRLLFIALFGLLLSSFSLIVLQSVMKGLQNGVIQRSKNLQGSHHLFVENPGKDLIQYIESFKQPFLIEYEVELLLKEGNYLAPTVLHGVNLEQSRFPSYLENFKFDSGLVLGSDLFRKLKTNLYTDISIISPAHTNSLFGDIPRQVTVPLEEVLYTSDSEYDQFHSFVRASVLHNLTRSKTYNKIRLFNLEMNDEIKAKLMSFQEIKKIKSWEEMNHSLVWALSLENMVMIGLFVGMSILVAVSITSGFLLFFDKIRTDLLAFWIMGLSLKQIKTYSIVFLSFLSALISLLGTLLGVWFLLLFESQKLKILPDVFLEQHLPILIETKGLIFSFAIPYVICLVFSLLIFKNLNNDERSFLVQLRSQGD